MYSTQNSLLLNQHKGNDTPQDHSSFSAQENKLMSSKRPERTSRYPASCSMDKGILFPGLKRRGCKDKSDTYVMSM